MDRRLWSLLLLAVASVAWAGPLIRIASDVDPLTVGFWRTGIATALLMPFALPRLGKMRRGLDRRDLVAMLASGAFLAVHFAAWIASVNLTTVASSVLLVSSSPVFVAGASIVVGRRVSLKVWAGIALALLGGGLVLGADSLLSGSLTGNVLALVGAGAVAGYLIIGGRLRAKVELVPYAFCVYGICAIALLLAAAVGRRDLSIEGGSSLWAVLALAVGPQLFGHTTLNLLLARLEPIQVAVATLAEPVGAGLIAAVLFGEMPGPLFFPGGLLLMIGIGLCLVGGTSVEGAGDGAR